MAKVEVELNSAGIKELLKGVEVEQLVGEYAAKVADRAGSGYSHDTKQMSGRVIASAYADTEEARKDSMENNTLLKALGGKA